MEIQTFCLKTGNDQKSRHFNREIEFAGIRLPVKWDELITGKQVYDKISGEIYLEDCIQEMEKCFLTRKKKTFYMSEYLMSPILSW